MGTEELKSMKTQLMSCVQGQIGNLKNVDTKELGEAIDMIKDLSQAIYYCTITDSMEKSEKSENSGVNNINYYSSTPVPAYRNMERANGYMYYPASNGGNGSSSSYTTYYTDPMVRDPREGRSAIRRRMYMEGKQMHKDPASQLQELETYLQELSTDITEMIKDASPEQRSTLRQKMTTLANKIM